MRGADRLDVVEGKAAARLRPRRRAHRIGRAAVHPELEHAAGLGPVPHALRLLAGHQPHRAHHRGDAEHDAERLQRGAPRVGANVGKAVGEDLQQVHAACSKSSLTTPSTSRTMRRACARHHRVVRHQDHRLPGLVEASNSSITSPPVVWSRLPVGSSASSSAGLGDERAGDRGALPLAARELAREVPAAVAETGAGEHLERAPAALVARHAAVQQRQLDVAQHARPREQVEALEDEADEPVAQHRQARRGEVRDLLVGEQVRALARRVEAAEDVHQRRLAGARRPHDRDVLAAPHLEVDAAQGVHCHLAGVVRLPDTFEREKDIDRRRVAMRARGLSARTHRFSSFFLGRVGSSSATSSPSTIPATICACEIDASPV